MGEGLEKRHVEPVFLPGARMLKTAGLADGLPMAQWRQQCAVLQNALRAKKPQPEKVNEQYRRRARRGAEEQETSTSIRRSSCAPHASKSCRAS